MVRRRPVLAAVTPALLATYDRTATFLDETASADERRAEAHAVEIRSTGEFVTRSVRNEGGVGTALVL